MLAYKHKHKKKSNIPLNTHTHTVLRSQRGIYPQSAGIRHFIGSQQGFHGYSMYRNNKRGPLPQAWHTTGTNLHLKQG